MLLVQEIFRNIGVENSYLLSNLFLNITVDIKRGETESIESS